MEKITLAVLFVISAAMSAAQDVVQFDLDRALRNASRIQSLNLTEAQLNLVTVPEHLQASDKADERKKWEAAARRKLARRLSPDQRDVLFRIHVSSQGLNAFLDQELVARIGLSDEQKSFVRAAVAAPQTQMSANFDSVMQPVKMREMDDDEREIWFVEKSYLLHDAKAVMDGEAWVAVKNSLTEEQWTAYLGLRKPRGYKYDLNLDYQMDKILKRSETAKELLGIDYDLSAKLTSAILASEEDERPRMSDMLNNEQRSVLRRIVYQLEGANAALFEDVGSELGMTEWQAIQADVVDDRMNFWSGRLHRLTIDPAGMKTDADQSEDAKRERMRLNLWQMQKSISANKIAEAGKRELWLQDVLTASQKAELNARAGAPIERIWKIRSELWPLPRAGE